MKYKKIKTITLLFLLLVGFSPQVATVHAETVQNTYVTDAKDYAAELNDSGFTNTTQDIQDATTRSLENLKGFTDPLSKSLAALGYALGVLAFAVMGLQMMNHGNGNIAEFIKRKESVKQSLYVIMFLFSVPLMSSAVLSIQLPSTVIINNNEVVSSTHGNATVGNSIMVPKSSIVDYVSKFKTTEAPKSTIDEALGKAQGAQATGIGAVILDSVSLLVKWVIYAPLKFLVTILGVSFYPVSFDTALYNSSASAVLMGGSIKELPFFQGGGTEITNSLIGALKQFTVIASILMFVIKQFAVSAIEVCCYWYAVRFLLKLDDTPLIKFLVKIGQGLAGMVLMPLAIQFMIDVDFMLSSSIISICSDGVSSPGLPLLSILPSMDNAGIFGLLFGICCAMVLLKLTISFFIRRLEITLGLILSPFVFLLHIFSKKSPVPEFWGTMVSSIFMTTIYAPIFALCVLMISFAGSSSGNALQTLCFYVLCLLVMYFSKDVVEHFKHMLMGGGHHSVAMKDAKGAASMDSIKQNLGLAGKFGVGAVTGAVIGAKLGKDYSQDVHQRASAKSQNKFETVGNMAKTVGGDIFNKGKQTQADNLRKFKNKFDAPTAAERRLNRQQVEAGHAHEDLQKAIKKSGFTDKDVQSLSDLHTNLDRFEFGQDNEMLKTEGWTEKDMGKDYFADDKDLKASLGKVTDAREKKTTLLKQFKAQKDSGDFTASASTMREIKTLDATLKHVDDFTGLKKELDAKGKVEARHDAYGAVKTNMNFLEQSLKRGNLDRDSALDMISSMKNDKLPGPLKAEIETLHEQIEVGGVDPSVACQTFVATNKSAVEREYRAIDQKVANHNKKIDAYKESIVSVLSDKNEAVFTKEEVIIQTNHDKEIGHIVNKNKIVTEVLTADKTLNKHQEHIKTHVVKKGPIITPSKPKSPTPGGSPRAPKR